MENNLVLPVQPHYQETDVVQGDDSQPYLEAKLYMERMDQEHNSCQEEKEITQGTLETDGPEALEQGVSLTVYPIRVPSTHFSCATVQWDMPDTPTDDPSSGSGSVDELSLSYGMSVDWVVNPLSSDIPSLSQEDQTNLQPEEDLGQTDVKVQQEQSGGTEDEVDSLLACDTLELHVCVTSSNGDEHEQFKETSQASENSRNSESVGFEKNNDETESPACIEDSGIQPSLKISDVAEEEYIHLLSEPQPEVEDEGDDKETIELYSQNWNEEADVNQNDTCLIVTTNCETISFTTELLRDSDTILEQEESVQSEYDQTNIIANQETLELQHAEMKTQESVWAVQQEEPTTEELIEHSGEVELPEYIDTQQDTEDLTKTEESFEQPDISDELEDIEQPKQQTTSNYEKESEESNQVECPSEPDTSDELSQPKSVDELEPSEQSNQSECSTEIEISQSKPRDIEQTNQADHLQQAEHTEYRQQQNEEEDRVSQTEALSSEHICEEEEQPSEETTILDSVQPVDSMKTKNGRVEAGVDREKARRLAEKLYRLEDVQRTDVVRHLDKDNEFSRAVGEEYLKFFDFTDQSLDEALRYFLKEVVLIGETQERERVLERFSSRYQQCNPDKFSSAGAVLTLTCAVMLLNTDLHGQNVGKAMSATDFVSNLEGMNDGQNFSKDLLKAFYNSIKNHQLEWAVEEKVLLNSMTLEQDSDQDASLRSKSNPFQDIAHDKKATVFHKGFLKRKAHADIDGKRTPWGKRSWKTFYAVLKGMVLYLQKDEYRKDWQNTEEVLSVHHALAERAQDYTKRPHVFRLQTADWRVFLFEAASTEQMNSWIGRINLVSALYSSPPFPAAVGSQKKFCRPILPATQSTLTLDKQLQSHAAMLHSFQEDLSALQQGAQEGRRTKARELEEHRHREEYFQHEMCRYEAYLQVLEIWQTLRSGNTSETADPTDLTLFDQELWKGVAEEEKEENEVDAGIKRSHSSPSLELEVATPPVVKVRRNISERRTYRKIVIPRRNKEL